MKNSFFDLLYDEYKVDKNKPIKLIEFFAGYGSQAASLKMLGLGSRLQHHKICEWAIPSIIAYASLHRDELPNYGVDYSKDLSKEEVANELFKLGVSADYNAPATLEQLQRLQEDKARLIYNSIKWENNLVDISRVKGETLEIEDTDKNEYILTYSFPCQDISLRGRGRGLDADSKTRSSLLWQVDRILDELHTLGKEHMPRILLMENVPPLVGKKHYKNFEKWHNRLTELGYSSYHRILNAKDFGIPQNRERVFMVSILNDGDTKYVYNFPKPFNNGIKLKHVLEHNVSDDYLLSSNMKDYVLSRTPLGDKVQVANNIIGKEAEKCAGTITTLAGQRGSDNFIVENLTQDEVDELIYQKSLGKTLCDRLLDENLVDEGDVINYTFASDRLERLDNGEVKKENSEGLSPTLLTSCDNLGVVVKESNDIIVKGNYSPSGHNAARIVSPEGIAPAVMENHGTITAVELSEPLEEEMPLKEKMCNKLIEDGAVREYDVIRHSYTNSRIRGEMKDIQQNNVCPTLDTRCDCLGVVVPEEPKVDINGTPTPIAATVEELSNLNEPRICSSRGRHPDNPNSREPGGDFQQRIELGPESTSNTLTTFQKDNYLIEPVNDEDIKLLGGVGEMKSNGGTQYYQQDRIYDSDGVAISVTTTCNPYYTDNVLSNLRIRKLTERECFRLMGLPDSYSDRIREVTSKMRCYHLRGDSIATPCLIAIFGVLLDIDYREAIDKLVADVTKDYKE